MYEEYWRDGQLFQFISMRYLGKQLGKGKDYVNKIFNLFAILGLIHKYNSYEIPSEILRAAKSHKKRENSYTATYFNIPEYTLELLAAAEQRAGYLYQHGFTMKGFCRAMFVGLLSQEEVYRYFPQQKNREIPQIDEEIQEEMLFEAINLIYGKGYLLEEDIIRCLRSKFAGKYQYDKQLKVIIPKIVEQFDLVKISKVSNEFKTRYSITEPGHFSVYIFRE